VTRHKSVSEETSHTIDEEIRSIIDKNYARAEEILKENIDILHAMAEALIKYETIDKYQIDDLMNRKPVGPPKGWGDWNSPQNEGKESKSPSLDKPLDSVGDPAEGSH
jgi:cell division protease FtsH